MAEPDGEAAGTPQRASRWPAGLRRLALPWWAGGRRLWWWCALALLIHLVALYLPGDPQRTIELPGLPGVDKVVHLLLFAVPVYLLGRLTRRVGLVATVFAIHAGVSELIQWTIVPYRDGDPFDAFADLTGIALAVLLLHRLRPPRS